QTTLVRSTADAIDFVDRFGLPVIAKLSTPWRGRNGTKLRSTTMIRTEQDLLALYDTCANDDTELLVQEYLPAGPGHDWIFHGYCDSRSVCLPSFTGVKTRSYPPHAGLTSMGSVRPNPRLAAEVHELLGKLGYYGIMDL